METIPIEALIPQRDPVLMVDELLEASDDAATTSLTVRDDNFFLDEEGKLAETGLLARSRSSAVSAGLPWAKSCIRKFGKGRR